MNISFDADCLIEALGLPDSAKVNQRIPKKMLLETGAPTAEDKRAITDGIEDIYWLAALKPGTVGIPAYQDAVRDYLEIAVLSINLRPAAKTSRINELVHRAIPYPVVLLSTSSVGASISLAHKRWAQNEAGKTVLDGDVLETSLDSTVRPDLIQQFVEALSIEKQPRLSIHALYQGWMDTVIAMQTAFLTHVFAVATSREQAAQRHQTLQELQRLRVAIERLKEKAVKVKQINHRVSLNLELQALQTSMKAMLAQL